MSLKVARVFSNDGGGNKGQSSCHYMDLFCQMANMDPNKLYDYFDLFAGSSIGAIIACAYADGMSPKQVLELLVNKSPSIFTGGAFMGTPMYSWIKGGWALLGKPFYSNDNDSELAKLLTSIFGNKTLSDLKGNVLITAVKQDAIKDSSGDNVYHYTTKKFSNTGMPNTEGASYRVVDCCLASAAAPLYFGTRRMPAYPKTETTFMDGGVYQNNPAGLAYSMINYMYPNYNRICLLSLGCGLGTTGVFDPSPPPSTEEDNLKLGPSDTIFAVMATLGVSLTGPQESMAQMLNEMAANLPKNNQNDFYISRCQWTYDPKANTEMDNSGDEFTGVMISTSEKQFNMDRMRNAIFISRMQL